MSPVITSYDCLLNQHILSSKSLTFEQVETVLKVTESMEHWVNTRRVPPLLKHCILATLFFESSTRTRLSFETAMLRLGGQVITVEEEKSLNQILFELQFINDLMKIIYELQEQA